MGCFLVKMSQSPRGIQVSPGGLHGGYVGWTMIFIIHTQTQVHSLSTWTGRGYILGTPNFFGPRSQSRWSPCGICGLHFEGHFELRMHLCELHLESKVVCSPYWFHVECTRIIWSPCGVHQNHLESMWSPSESSGVHQESPEYRSWHIEFNVNYIIDEK